MTAAAGSVRGAALGRERRGLDLVLGCSAIVPLIGCDALLYWPVLPLLIVRTLAVIWAACLLAFFSGVRRGLSFSEPGGARIAEIATLLCLFALAVLAMLFASPLVAAAGLALVGFWDALAAGKGQAPRHFRLFRPVQMGVAVAALLLIQLKAG